MSDKQEKNIEQQAQETAASSDGLQAPDAELDNAPPPGPTSAKTKASAPAIAPVAPARKGSSALAWLSLLLALLVAAGLGWSMREQQRIQSGVTARLQSLESAAGREQADLDALGARWQTQLGAAVEQLRGQLQAGAGDIDGEMTRLTGAIGDVQAQLAAQRGELDRYSAQDKDAWSLAEVGYLLRLANQRLIMAGDVVAAQALLGSADNVLRELDDPTMHDVRAAVAADMAAVRAVPRVDVEGTYLRLAALAEQADKLVIFELQPEEAQPAQAREETWQDRLKQGYEEALAKLSSYIIIRRRDVPMQALMDPQWEGLVRQNMRMLLEQAQVALLSGNRVLYGESLERARRWVGEFFESDGAAAQAMSREITQLMDVEIAAELPDISRSLQALDSAMKQRLEQGGRE